MSRFYRSSTDGGNELNFTNRKDFVYLVLTGFFISNALLAEVVGGKLIQVGPFTMSVGVIPWPIVFLTTDVMNEYFGRAGVKRITYLTVGLLLFAVAVMYLAVQVPAAKDSPVSDEAFNIVIGQSLWITIASIIAFAVSQLVDVFVFWLFRDRTGSRYLWLRSTGSTVVSQLIDTFVIIGIAFRLPGKITTSKYVELSLTHYSYKLLIAIGLTPFIYIVHNVIHSYLGEQQAETLIEEAVLESHELT
jgi:uncharacterized integral membrane protein (TIGR00697 family)